MERYDGADSKVNEMDFSEEYRDENDPEKGSIYVINSDEVSEETYNELCEEDFCGADEYLLTESYSKQTDCHVDSDNKTLNFREKNTCKKSLS